MHVKAYSSIVQHNLDYRRNFVFGLASWDNVLHQGQRRVAVQVGADRQVDGRRRAVGRGGARQDQRSVRPSPMIQNGRVSLPVRNPSTGTGAARMSVRIRAAVAWEAGAKLSIEEFDLDDPRDDEILVRVEATGVCHTDESSRLGLLPVVYPIILGHEGSGTVEAAGKDVTRVKAGDKVLFTPDYCGTCEQCVLGYTPYCEQVIPVTFTGTRPDGSPRAHAAERQAGPRLVLRPVLVCDSFTGHRAQRRARPARRPAALPGGLHLRRADRRRRDAQRDRGRAAPDRGGVRHRRGRPRRGDGRARVRRARDRGGRPGAAPPRPGARTGRDAGRRHDAARNWPT